MQRTLSSWLVASMFLGLLGAPGCGDGPETLSERKRRSEVEAGADQVEPAGTTAAPAEGTDTAMEDLGAGGAAPVEEKVAEKSPKSGKKASGTPKANGKKARAAAKEDDTAVAGDNRDRVESRDDAAMRELREEKTLRRQEAEYHAKRGDDFYQQNQFEEAVKEYDQALTLDPSLDEARSRWQSAKTILGQRSGEIAALSDTMTAGLKISREQAQLEIDRNLNLGREALAAGDVDLAESRVSQAVDAINLEQDYDPAKRREANDLLKKVRDEKAERRAAREAELRSTARDKAEEESQREAKVRQSQVQELLRKTAEFLRQHEYEKAVEACNRILKIEPDNRVAKFWLSDAQEQIVQVRRLKLIDERLEANRNTREAFARATATQDNPVLFPPDDEWRAVQARGRGLEIVKTDDPEPIRRIKNALEDKVEFDFDKTPLADVVQQLRTVTGAKIGIDPAIDAPNVPVSGSFHGLPASNVLNLILENVGLTYIFKENILYITQQGQKVANVEFGIYNVSDILNKIRDFTGPELLLRPTGEQGASPISFTPESKDEETQLDPEKLEALIKASTGGEEAWGEPNSMEFHSGQFLVTASRELHGKVQTVLENLRKDSDLFVVIEARFVDLQDDFLEDVGIDYRALGLANNYGTPFGNVINDGSTGGQDLGFVKQGSPVRDVTLIMGQDRWAGRIRHIIDGFTGAVQGDRLSAGQGIGGLTLQSTILSPFQINSIIRAVQETLDARQLTAPVVTAHNGQRVFVSVITQRAYIADYNLVSGGTGFAIIEVADPEVQTFQEGVILDVDPVVSHDKKYVTLDVRPTLATLIGGVISTILISLGSFTNVATMVPIGVPEISLQQSFTSVTVPNGGTVLLGGFKSLNESKFTSYLPILGKIPLLGNLFRRKGQVVEKRSLVILLSVRIVDLRGAEAKTYNAE
jgi:general secretion pathway protein D